MESSAAGPIFPKTSHVIRCIVVEEIAVGVPGLDDYCLGTQFPKVLVEIGQVGLGIDERVTRRRMLGQQVAQCLRRVLDPSTTASGVEDEGSMDRRR